MATAPQAAAHLFISVSRFRDLVGAGTITRQGSNGYTLDKVREEYIRNAQLVMAGRGSDGGAALSAKRGRLADAQAAAAEFRFAQAQGQFASIEVMGKIMDAHVLGMRERALSLAGKISDGLTCHTPKDRAEVFEIIRSEVHEALGDMANPPRFTQAALKEIVAAS
jgi:hypothetical protein